MTKEQYFNWHNFRLREERKERRTREDAIMVATYFAEVFNKKYWLPCGCNKKRWNEWVDKLNEHFLSIDQPE